MSIEKTIEQVAKEVAEAQIRASVAEALGRNPGQVVEAVVRIAMSERDRNGYSHQPIFVDQFNKMIRDEALAACKEFIDEQRPTIKKMIADSLGLHGKKALPAMVEKLVAALSTQLKVHISIGEDR